MLPLRKINFKTMWKMIEKCSEMIHNVIKIDDNNKEFNCFKWT